MNNSPKKRKNNSRGSQSHSPTASQEFPTTQHCSRDEVRIATQAADLSRSIFISESSSGSPNHGSTDVDISRDSTCSEDKHKVHLTQDGEDGTQSVTSDGKYLTEQAANAHFLASLNNKDGSWDGGIFRYASVGEDCGEGTTFEVLDPTRP